MRWREEKGKQVWERNPWGETRLLERVGSPVTRLGCFERSLGISPRLAGVADLWTGCGWEGGGFCLVTAGGGTKPNPIPTCEIPRAPELLSPEFLECARPFPALSYLFFFFF